MESDNWNAAGTQPIEAHLDKYLAKALARAETRGIPIQFIIIDLSPVTDIDASATHFLKVAAALNITYA